MLDQVHVLTWNLVILKVSHLFVRGLSHVEDLPPEREDAVAVSSNHAQSGHGQRLGGVSFSEDQRAL